MESLTWTPVKEYEEITFAVCNGVARIAFNRPEVRNAFTPKTVDELWEALILCHESQEIGAVIITGEGPSAKDGGLGILQRRRPKRSVHNRLQRRKRHQPLQHPRRAAPDSLHEQGGHRRRERLGCRWGTQPARGVRFDIWRVKEHARFKQTDADVASFDGGFGSAYLARQVGQKRAREIFFLGAEYSAQEAYEMGMVNRVVPHDRLERVAYDWAREIMSKSPTAIKMLKFGFNLIDDGLVGQQVYAGEATRLAYGTDEAKEGRDAFLDKRPRDFSRFPKFP